MLMDFNTVFQGVGLAAQKACQLLVQLCLTLPADVGIIKTFVCFKISQVQRYCGNKRLFFRANLILQRAHGDARLSSGIFRRFTRLNKKMFKIGMKAISLWLGCENHHVTLYCHTGYEVASLPQSGAIMNFPLISSKGSMITARASSRMQASVRGSVGKRSNLHRSRHCASSFQLFLHVYTYSMYGNVLHNTSTMDGMVIKWRRSKFPD